MALRLIINKLYPSLGQLSRLHLLYYVCSHISRHGQVQPLGWNLVALDVSYENTSSIVGFTPGATCIVNLHKYDNILWSIEQTVLFVF